MAGKRLVTAAVAAVTLALTGCQGDHPSWNPLAPCPHGEHRIRDVTQRPNEVCVKW
jgi:hypothetical protein